MVRKPINRNPPPESNNSDKNNIDLTMPDIMEDYAESETPPPVVLPETPSPPSTLPPSPPPAPPSTLISLSLAPSLFTATKASRQPSHGGHSPVMFLPSVTSPLLIATHPPHVPVAGLSFVHTLEPASVLAPN
ncbi:hypothetical protein K457DRAFT_124352 [Linnemannia elongata AG-77]|uniref:Uncharacterized protein n=1 Tax=Linnemannia elongata AG-77 TaxID=1314771 RepID=A0A197K2D5_9FUNG|nr:hypothetical protein K457DRAFT_124352 [Linnemannia elongata AG-77]